MSRAFVILEHSGNGPKHFDLMLEQEGPALATWRLEDWRGMESAPARRLLDHREEYLAYEGPVSGGRGQVRRVEAGTYELLRHEKGLWEVELKGSALQGRFELRRVGPAGDAWEVRRMKPPL